MRNLGLCLALLTMCLPMLASAQEAVPSVIPYSGFLEVPEGALSANLEVRLQREDEAGVWTTVWCEQHLNTALHQRRFHINIGRPSGNPPACDNRNDFSLEDDFHGLFAKGQAWLELVVDGTPLPRQQFLTAPYAAVARGADDFRVRGHLAVGGTIDGALPFFRWPLDYEDFPDSRTRCESLGDFGNCSPRVRLTLPEPGTYLVIFNARLFRNGGNNRGDQQGLLLRSQLPNGNSQVAEIGARRI